MHRICVLAPTERLITILPLLENEISLHKTGSQLGLFTMSDYS